MNGDVITHQHDEFPDECAVEYRLPAEPFLTNVSSSSPWIQQFIGLGRDEAKACLADYWADLKSTELMQWRDKLLSSNAPVALVAYDEKQFLCLGYEGYDQNPSWYPFLLPSPLNTKDYESQLDRFKLNGNAFFEELLQYFGGLCVPYIAYGILPPFEWCDFDRQWMMNYEPHQYWEGSLAVYIDNGDTLLLNSKGETAWWLPREDTVVAGGTLNEFVADYLVGDKEPAELY